MSVYYLSSERCGLVALNTDEIDSIDKQSFVRWLYNLNLFDWVDAIDGGLEERTDDYSKTGYCMPCDWNHSLIDELAMFPTIEEVEVFLGEVGFRKAFKLADECGYYEEADYKVALTTDEGLRRLFFAVLDALIVINDDLKEVEDFEYSEVFPQNELE